VPTQSQSVTDKTEALRRMSKVSDFSAAGYFTRFQSDNTLLLSTAKYCTS